MIKKKYENILNSLNAILSFKEGGVVNKIAELENFYIGKRKSDIKDLNDLYQAALQIRKVSAQIDEIIHAAGIINCLPFILKKSETIVSLSLASGAKGDGIDLVTNERIAEFKFARWQEDGANGSRRRQVFADLVSLFITDTPLRKELYVFNAEKISKVLNSQRATWLNVLSKSGNLKERLEAFLIERQLNAKTLRDIMELSQVRLFDIDNILQYPSRLD
jgi:hypothetical protein